MINPITIRRLLAVVEAGQNGVTDSQVKVQVYVNILFIIYPLFMHLLNNCRMLTSNWNPPPQPKHLLPKCDT